jgi:hypothetical protein
MPQIRRKTSTEMTAKSNPFFFFKATRAITVLAGYFV